MEVALAVGIVSFAFTSLVALLPSGLDSFRKAMDTSVAAQIAQRVINDVQQAEFDTLLASAAASGGPGAQYYALPLRRFDEQGNETAVNPLYTVRVRGSRPGAPDPGSNQNQENFTSLPAAEGRFHSRDLSFMTVEIVNNPGGKPLAVDSSGTFLWDRQSARQQNLQILSYVTVIARNGTPAQPTHWP